MNARKNPWLTTWNVWVEGYEEESEMWHGDTAADAVREFMLCQDHEAGDPLVVCAQGYATDVHRFNCQWSLNIEPVKR